MKSWTMWLVAAAILLLQITKEAGECYDYYHGVTRSMDTMEPVDDF